MSIQNIIHKCPPANYIFNLLTDNSDGSISSKILLICASLLIILLFNKKILPCNCKASNYVTPIKFEYAVPDEAKPNWKGKRIPNTNVYNEDDPTHLQCYCPATGQFLSRFDNMTKLDMDKLISKCSIAQKSWKSTTFKQRLQVLSTLHNYILHHQDEIARVCCRDSGKTMLDASMGEILVTLEKITWIIEHGVDVLTKEDKRPGPTNFFMQFYKGAKVVYEPLGVVAAIVSWNYPFHNLLGPIVAAIFAGNGIVVKCSEQVVWSSVYFIKLVKKVLEICGHDPNLVQLCYCFPPNIESKLSDDSGKSTADYFTSHPTFKHITFIGSKPVAHHVLKQAAETITPVVVELGGKDSFICLDSVQDLNKLSSIIMRGTFQSSGQNCIGIERVIVANSKYDELVNILEKRVASLRLGSDIDDLLENIDMGAMISDNRFEQLELLVKDAVNKGARLLYGGSRFCHPNFPQGHYFQPTLLVDVTPEMDIATNEVFGPILTVLKGGNDLNNIIKVSNSSPFGLGGSVFGKYEDCCYVADKLITGNVAINDFATFYVCQLPFGGCNGSGYGKFGGEEGLLGLCNAKSICYDKLPFVSTQIPAPLNYPIKDNEVAWQFVKAMNTASYTWSLWERIKNIFKLAKNA
ncbi:probable Putative aldehyde dehydrogenase-like protein YHR039C [Saccharomycodes ludwigii]|uniref:Probable Putative aldehyde dehydrogenase-like protein YHR039C n=1 Tax=Saccharomycodes ludwigii TaxID=36035 RepID=A0A376B2T3_9ASCO|nr:hypothetical protein SCDLUD_004603 [Saccharomycodes ludwigii]KAH3899174.1 hypothetical protein SCDLUD_004603 [Saccharomycodes ludwigii]SSD58961.1 probable Putative aldehyde dehydrogenase-like protein YHR039C [Saccharomycodes ludwigii]